MTVLFNARRHAPSEYRSSGRGGPVTACAQALHATLYGLPTHEESLPTALDALLQATHTTTAPDAVLRQVAEQLRNAAEIIQRYQYQAQWDRHPAAVAEQLSDAHNYAQHIARALDRVAPAFSHQPTTDTSPRAQAAHSRSSATTPVASPPSPATPHHR
ncbi:hypothetical protein ACIPEL_03225 [Streptomyces griseoviridis]